MSQEPKFLYYIRQDRLVVAFMGSAALWMQIGGGAIVGALFAMLCVLAATDSVRQS